MRIDCLGMAITEQAGKHGIWAGYSERKLRAIKKAWRRKDRKGVKAESPWAVGGLDELARRGLEWGSVIDDEDS